MRTNTRQYLLTLVAAVALVGSGLGVAALAQPDAGDVFTGCLNENSGVLRNVAVGFEPAKKCNPQEAQITWDRAGPAFEDRIAALEERVAELEEPFGTLGLYVDCDAGDSLQAALDEAQDHPGPVHIGISGVCVESVSIARGEISVSGSQPGDGLQAPTAADTVIFIGTAYLRLEDLTITGGTSGVHPTQGSHLEAYRVTVQGTSIFGINVDATASATLYDCTIIDNSGFGVTASGGGVRLIGGQISGNQFLISGNQVGLNAEGGGVIDGSSLTITGNTGWTSAVAWDQGTMQLTDSTIENNAGTGIVAGHGGQVNVGRTRIASNGGGGVGTGHSADLNVGGGTVIENNDGTGIAVSGLSTVEVGGEVTISNNSADGIWLGDSSYGYAGVDGVQIINNGGWGINCAGPTAVKEAQNGFNNAEIVFSGNTNGDTNCP